MRFILAIGLGLILPMLAMGNTWAQDMSIRSYVDVYELGRKQGQKQGDDKLREMEQRLFSQAARAAQNDITAQVEWGHERLHFGDSATIRAHIHNNLDVPVRMRSKSFEMRVPCELYGSADTVCDSLPQLSPPAHDIELPPRGHTTLQWRFTPTGPFLFLSNSFRTGPNYQLVLSFEINLPEVKLNPGAISDDMFFDKRPIPITISTPLPVDLNPWSLAFWAIVGSLVGGIVHAAARTATLKRLRNGDYNLFSDARIRQDEIAYMGSFLFVGAVMAALLAASLGVSSEAKRLISARILDAQGALVFGFIIHFMTYDLGYNKLVPIWRNLMRH